MSLPHAFANSEHYFTDCLSFLRNYQHLYNFANTDILIQDVLNKILIENFENLDIFAQEFNLAATEDDFLKNFFIRLQRLEVTREFVDIEVENVECEVPLSPKKRHEIVRLSREVAAACQQISCDTVVDFGSGLGYLDQQIFQTTDLNVLGLECNDSHYVGAKTRQRKYHPESKERVKFIKHLITEDSNIIIQEYLHDKFGDNTKFCITGLHSCADLTVDAINLFLKMADAKVMALMPCCYHKMKVEVSEEVRFQNFPLSKCLKGIFEEAKGYEFLRVPFLRLAAQPPNLTGGSLEDLVFNLLARASLQLYAYRNECKLKRNKRKAVKTKTMAKDFISYIQDATTKGFSLIPISSNSEEISGEKVTFNLEDLNSIWRQYSDNLILKQTAILILLQNYLQPIFENLILYDRIVYLQENGVKNCSFKIILNEKISPRCLCLLAYK